MTRCLKVVAVLLLGAVVLGLTGCADSDASPGYTPTEAPTKDDLSHGWGPTQTQ